MTDSPDALRNRYETEGYLLGLPILDDAEVLHYRAVYDRLEAEAAKKPTGKRITNQHHVEPEVWRLATHPRVLSYAKALLGEDVVLISSGFFAKQPGDKEHFVAWHQDTTYWGLEPPKALTIWIAIDDSDVENGCMRVIPRSHLLGLLPHEASKQAGNMLGQNQSIDTQHFDEASAVDFVLKAGQASAHHGELIHGSNANVSTRRRCGMTVRFTTPDVKPIVEGDNRFTDKPLLVCGKDRYGHFEYAPMPGFA